MKKYEEIFFEVCLLQVEEVIRTSGIDGMEDGIGNDAGDDKFPEL